MKKRIKVMKKYFKKSRGKEVSKANEYLSEDMEQALIRAKELISVEEDQYSEPFVIKTPDSRLSTGKVNYRVSTVVVDKKHTFEVQYDKSLITSIFLSNQSLYYHKTGIDHITGLVSYDFAGELNLFDVLHIETLIDYEVIKDYRVQKVNLKLNLVDGSNIIFYLRHKYIADDVLNGEILSKEEDYIIKTIKQAVRLSK